MTMTSHAKRRQQLITRMNRETGGGVALIPAAPEQPRSRDTTYPYRQNSDLLYLSDFPEPEAMLVLVAGGTPQQWLFCRDKHEEREIWDGCRYGPEAAASHFGLDRGESIARLDEKLPDLLADQPAVWIASDAPPSCEQTLSTALGKVRQRARDGVRPPSRRQDLREALDAMRLVKDGTELGRLRQAACIASDAHRRAMRAAAPGVGEWQIEAELLHAFRHAGASGPAYAPIVAGGANACVLHYVENSKPLEDGALLLIDAGCEIGGYASDITRSFPVNGRFNGPQRDLYQLVLSAQLAAIDCCRAGTPFSMPHEHALRILVQGFVDLGLLKGSIDGLIEREDYKRFYMHRTSHWLGLDVHDVGDYRPGGEWQTLRPGMVLTIEPGCYLRAADDIPTHFHNIGIRIEDDIHVTAADPEVLTAGAPTTIADIENLMRP